MRALRILFFVGLLALGVCAAWPFRRPAESPAAAPKSPVATDLPLRGRDVTLEASPPEATSPAELDEPPSVRRDIRPVSLTEARPDLLNFAPPVMPLDFAAAAKEPKIEPDKPPAAYRTYRLRDGDTLESIAERYLGSSQRAEELFELNRQALARPDLLPVGTAIQIPPRE